jgi:hypothetical protein
MYQRGNLQLPGAQGKPTALVNLLNGKTTIPKVIVSFKFQLDFFKRIEAYIFMQLELLVSFFSVESC